VVRAARVVPVDSADPVDSKALKEPPHRTEAGTHEADPDSIARDVGRTDVTTRPDLLPRRARRTRIADAAGADVEVVAAEETSQSSRHWHTRTTSTPDRSSFASLPSMNGGNSTWTG
jgi:hypothetical protein